MDDFVQPIGIRKKDKSDVEQISFKMCGDEADTKRRFHALVKDRNLDIREVLIEFIHKYVEYDGELGVVPLKPGAVAAEVYTRLQDAKDDNEKLQRKQKKRKA